MKKLLCLFMGFSLFGFIASAQAGANEGRAFKDKINSGRLIKDSDDILVSVPIFYKRGSKICMVVFGDKGSVKIDNRDDKNCRDVVLVKGKANKYKMKPIGGPVSTGHHHHHKARLKLTGPGVCNDYHGVGNNSCHTEVSGDSSLLWCRVGGNQIQAEIYYGPAGFNHLGNTPKQNIPSGHPCE